MGRRGGPHTDANDPVGRRSQSAYFIAVNPGQHHLQVGIFLQFLQNEFCGGSISCMHCTKVELKKMHLFFRQDLLERNRECGDNDFESIFQYNRSWEWEALLCGAFSGYSDFLLLSKWMHLKILHWL